MTAGQQNVPTQSYGQITSVTSSKESNLGMWTACATAEFSIATGESVHVVPGLTPVAEFFDASDTLLGKFDLTEQTGGEWSTGAQSVPGEPATCKVTVRFVSPERTSTVNCNSGSCS